VGNMIGQVMVAEWHS